MTEYLRQHNSNQVLFSTIYVATQGMEVDPFDVHAAFVKFALECKANKNINIRDLYKCVAQFVPNMQSDDFNSLRAILSVFCLENMVNDVVNKMIIEQYREEAKHDLMGDLYNIVLHFDWENEYRRLHEESVSPNTVQFYPTACKLSTYAYRSLVNNAKAFNRNEYPCRLDARIAKIMAIIDAYLDKLSFLKGEEVMIVPLDELVNVVVNNGINFDKNLPDKVNNLMWARRAIKSLNSPIDHGELMKVGVEDEYDMFETSHEELVMKLEDTVAEVFGDDVAYITHMHQQQGISFRSMPNVYARYKTIVNHLQHMSAQNSEAKEHLDSILTALRRGGDVCALKALSNTPACQYLSSAVARTEEDLKLVEYGELHLEDVVDVPSAGFFMYKYHLAWPNKVPQGKVYEQQKLFKRRLCNNGLDFVAKELENHCIQLETNHIT